MAKRSPLRRIKVDEQNESVQQFFLSLYVDMNDSIVEAGDGSVFWVSPLTPAQEEEMADIAQKVAAGLKQLENGEYKTYDRDALQQFVKDITSRGRERIAREKKNT